MIEAHIFLNRGPARRKSGPDLRRSYEDFTVVLIATAALQHLAS